MPSLALDALKNLPKASKKEEKKFSFDDAAAEVFKFAQAGDHKKAAAALKAAIALSQGDGEED